MHFPMEFINIYDISSSRFDEYTIKPVFAINWIIIKGLNTIL